MKNTIRVLNRLVAEKTIKGYAIGGAMGAMWYMEAVTTLDLDVFVIFSDDDAFDPISPIYRRLAELGYAQDLHLKECVDIEGVPVQFLPVYNALLNDAMKCAKSFNYEDVQTFVISAEYLAAICVQTGRSKDKLRVEMFMQSDKFDKQAFFDILNRHELKGRFDQWNLA